MTGRRRTDNPTTALWRFEQTDPCELSGHVEELSCCDDCGCDPELIIGEIVTGEYGCSTFYMIAPSVSMKVGHYICDLHNAAISKMTDPAAARKRGKA